MIQEILKGYNSLDNCYKFRNQDSTISRYTYSKRALNNKVMTVDPELNTNSIYLLIGSEDNKQKVYVGKAKVGADGTSALRRINQHLSNQARLKEKYFDYWQQAIIFVCNNVDRDTKWTTTDIDDLEALLIKDTVPGYSWNSKKETESKDISSGLARSYSRKLLDIKEYVSELGYHFFDDFDAVEDITYNAKLEAEEKKIIDKTVSLKTINLEPFAKVPEYMTPESVVNNTLDLLPWDKFNSSTTFFDPACKGGEFLVLIHDRLCEILQNDPIFNGYEGTEKTIRIHDHIVKNQLYGIALDRACQLFTIRTVYGTLNTANNIKLAGRSSVEAVRNVIEKEFKGMQFEVVTGNPPYQENDDSGKDGGSALYDKFMRLGTMVATANGVVSFVIPMRWMVQYRVKGIDKEWVKNELECNKYRSLYYSDESTDLFPSVNIRGGSCTLLDRTITMESVA